jgi:ankyrin repeat protein
MKERPQMVALLVELGADPLAVDGMGQPIAIQATTPDIDRPVMEKIRALTAAELLSAERGSRRVRGGLIDLVASLALGDWDTASRLVRDSPELLAANGPGKGALHLMAKRGAASAVKWLLDHGADPNALWAHWDVTALHLAAWHDHADVVRSLLAAGADPTIKDNRHDADAIGWAEFFGRTEIAEILRKR